MKYLAFCLLGCFLNVSCDDQANKTQAKLAALEGETTKLTAQADVILELKTLLASSMEKQQTLQAEVASVSALLTQMLSQQQSVQKSVEGSMKRQTTCESNVVLLSGEVEKLSKLVAGVVATRNAQSQANQQERGAQIAVIKDRIAKFLAEENRLFGRINAIDQVPLNPNAPYSGSSRAAEAQMKADMEMRETMLAPFKRDLGAVQAALQAENQRLNELLLGH